MSDLRKSTPLILSSDWQNIVETNKRMSVVSNSNSLLIMAHSHKRPCIEFCTKSSYTGEWNQFGMCGYGVYTFTNKVQYHGYMREGVFHGKGTLIYPNGNKIKGIWKMGHNRQMELTFADGLEFEDESDWWYCKHPDRRYYPCFCNGINPIGESFITANKCVREIPTNLYDTEEAFYDKKKKSLIDTKTGEICR